MNDFNYKNEYIKLFKKIYFLYCKKRILNCLNNKNSTLTDRLMLSSIYKNGRESLVSELFEYVNNVSMNNNISEIIKEV